jgi:hypothetical protein
VKPEPPAPAIIDELGVVKAQIALLVKQEDKLKQQLIDYFQATQVNEFHGELFDATVSEYDKKTLDMKAVRKQLSPQFIRAHTSKTPIVRVLVMAKKRS